MANIKYMIYIPEELLDWYRSQKDITGCPISENIRRALKEYQEKIERQNNDSKYCTKKKR